MRFKSILLCAITLCLVLIICGCQSKENSKVTSYKVQVVSDGYKGYFRSKIITKFSYDNLDLLYSTGDYIQAGEVIAELKKPQLDELEKLYTKKNLYESKLNEISKRLNELLNGDIQNATEIKDQLDEITETIDNYKYEMQQNNFDVNEANSEYQKDIEDLDREIEKKEIQLTILNESIAEKQANVETLIADLEKYNSDDVLDITQDEMVENEKYIEELYSQINILNDEISTTKNEIVEITEEIEQLNSNKEYRMISFNSTIDKLELNDENTKNSLKKYEEIYKQISSADTSNSTIINLLNSMKETKETYEETINSLIQQINDFEKQRIVSDFAGQIEVLDDVAIVYSQEVQFIFEATERQMNELTQLDNLTTMKYNKTGILSPNATIYDSESSELGRTSYFKMIYDIMWDDELQINLNGTTGVMTTPEKIIIPDEYLFTDSNDNYYVVISGKKVRVTANKYNEGWEILDGISEGDLLDTFEE